MSLRIDKAVLSSQAGKARRQMELRALRYFVMVAEERHFGRAAERLRIAQPAVSQQIARLERELGTRLLNRSPRRVELTDAGSRVLDAARDALAAADRVTAAARQPTTTLRVGAIAGLTDRIERAVDALRVVHPTVELVLADLPLAQRLAALRQGDLDFALIRGGAAAPGLVLRPAWSEPLHVVVSTRHRFADRATVELRELADDPLRLLAPGYEPGLSEVVDGTLRAAGIRPRLGRPACTVQNTVIEVGADLRAWTLLPEGLVAFAGSTRVRSIRLVPPVSVPGHVAIRDEAAPRCVQAAIDVFRDALADGTGRD
jgi:DNA-binding transcriptional LysR family regulator